LPLPLDGLGFSKLHEIGENMNVSNTTLTDGRIWAFDLGKGSIGEAVRQGSRFLHKASLLIPAEFAETKTAAGKRRMWRTRQAHKAREQWLDEVMRRAGIEPLHGRRVGKVDDNGHQKWVQTDKGDYRLEREFPPSRFGKDKAGQPKERVYPGGKAKDGAPAQTGKDFTTCYNSALLRIKLLRGEPLEPWQLYKALHSAIQKRGYGQVPWATRELKRTGRTEEEIEQEMAKKDPEYKAAVTAWGKFKQEFSDSRFHFPCYFDAAKMGLWQPDVLQERINCQAQSTRKVRFDREDVEKEIAMLARQAAQQLPQIQNSFETIKATGWAQSGKSFAVAAKDFGEFLVYGPAGAPPNDAKGDFGRYLFFRKRNGIHPGGSDDWMGATAQKVPRFDNRIINRCALLDGLQVCNVGIRYDAKQNRPYPDSLLASEVTFLMKLKNTLVSRTDGQRKLSPEEIRTVFKSVTVDAMAIPPGTKDWARKVAECYALTKTAWGSKKGVKELGLRPLAGHESIKSPKADGRSRFSRPALRLIRALILSGQNPDEFRRRLLARETTLLDEIGMDVRDLEPTSEVNGVNNFLKQPRPWILIKHLKFLEDLEKANNSWEDIHIPEQRLDSLEARHTAEDDVFDKQAAIRELIGNINDPVVRHRLGVFTRRLEELHRAHGVPATIVLEFVREDFMGDQAKRDLQKFQSDREKSRKEAREKAAELGAGERSAALKYELYKAQGCICLYCGQTLAATDMADHEIEHIVPRSQNGPDAMVNYVLAHKECNEQKDEQTPYQWKHGKEGWNAYENIVKQHAVALRNKKVQLLLREDAPELVQRYTALAETAWISKLAQTIISIHFGWRNGIDYQGENPAKRVIVISGGLTARIRRKYHLNSLLNPPPPGTLNLNEWEANAEKNRDDDRHHALDAMIISFLPAWVRDAHKEHFFRFPETVHENARAFFENEINQVAPKFIAFLKPAFEETFYGQRTIAGEQFIVGREKLAALAVKVVANKRVLKARKDIEFQRIVDPQIRSKVESFLNDNLSLTLDRWDKWCEEFRLGEGGQCVGKILATKSKAGSLDEYKDISKDRTGQFRRGAKHRGYFVFERPAPSKNEPDKMQIDVRPVFVFQNVAQIGNELSKQHGVVLLGYFESGCQVHTTGEWEYKGQKFPASNYICTSIWSNRNAKLKHPRFGEIGPVGLRILFNAGLKRV